MKKLSILAIVVCAATAACSGGGSVMPAGVSAKQPDAAPRTIPQPEATVPCIYVAHRDAVPCNTPHPLPTPTAAPRPTTNPHPTPV